jgi:D-mannonate dehydratase
MGVSYDIIEVETNQIVNTFGLKWLQNYTDFNIPKVERYDMLDYCQEEIEKLSEKISELEIQQSQTFTDMKDELISKIYPCNDEDELKEILQTFLDERNPNTDESNINHMEWLIHHFKSLQDFLIPYIFSSYEKYRAEISY